MPNANYTAGRAREYRTVRLVEAAGYSAHRTAGSHGVWDVIGIGPQGVLLIQCKLNAKPTAVEWEAMREYPAPPNAVKLVHFYVTGTVAPLVLPVSKES